MSNNTSDSESYDSSSYDSESYISSESTDCESSLPPFTQALESFEKDLSETIESLHHLQKKVHEAEHTHQNLYHSLGVRDIVHTFLPVWKKEGRLSSNGLFVQLSEKEKIYLGISTQELNIYDFFALLLHKS